MNTQTDNIFINKIILDDNTKIFENIRSWVSFVSSIASGLLGLTGFKGILIYLLGVLITNLFIFFNKDKFKNSFININKLYYSNVFTDLLLFIFVWVVVYNIAHIL